MAKVGRPTKYGAGRRAQVLQAVRRGVTTDNAARFAGVAPSTLYRWRVEIRELRAALEQARAATEARRIRAFVVEENRRLRARGFLEEEGDPA